MGCRVKRLQGLRDEGSNACGELGLRCIAPHKNLAGVEPAASVLSCYASNLYIILFDSEASNFFQLCPTDTL